MLCINIFKWLVPLWPLRWKEGAVYANFLLVLGFFQKPSFSKNVASRVSDTSLVIYNFQKIFHNFWLVLGIFEKRSEPSIFFKSSSQNRAEASNSTYFNIIPVHLSSSAWAPSFSPQVLNRHWYKSIHYKHIIKASFLSFVLSIYTGFIR